MLIFLSSQLHTPLQPQSPNILTDVLHASFSPCLEAVSPTSIHQKKARIKGAAEYMDAKNIPYSHNDLFRFHDVSKKQDWAIIKEESLAAG
jgi:hypothetical protein